MFSLNVLCNFPIYQLSNIPTLRVLCRCLIELRFNQYIADLITTIYCIVLLTENFFMDSFRFIKIALQFLKESLRKKKTY